MKTTGNAHGTYYPVKLTAEHLVAIQLAQGAFMYHQRLELSSESSDFHWSILKFKVLPSVIGGKQQVDCVGEVVVRTAQSAVTVRFVAKCILYADSQKPFEVYLWRRSEQEAKGSFVAWCQATRHQEPNFFSHLAGLPANDEMSLDPLDQRWLNGWWGRRKK